jgi:hypothetical protein
MAWPSPQLPVASDHKTEAERVARIKCESMQEVTGNIPIACEYSLSRRWYKGAEAAFADGQLIPWEPNTHEE